MTGSPASVRHNRWLWAGRPHDRTPECPSATDVSSGESASPRPYYPFSATQVHAQRGESGPGATGPFALSWAFCPRPSNLGTLARVDLKNHPIARYDHWFDVI